MKTRYSKRAAAIFFFFLIVVNQRYAVCQDQMTEAQAFAEAEWKLYDLGKFEQMYDSTFDDVLKQQITRDDWLRAARQISGQRGNLISRELGTKTSSMGFYRFIFNSRCTGGRVFEDISVTKRDSDWKVMAIWVRPNLE